MGQHVDFDYAMLAKMGFLLGVVVLAVGAGGEFIGRTYLESLPAWEAALFFDLEVLGVFVGFFSPVIFGVVLPLVE